MSELVVTSFGGSFRGGRETNEDALGQREPRDPEIQGRQGSLYVVAEGDEALRHALIAANRRILETASTCEKSVRRLLALTRARRTPDNASAMVISVATAEGAKASV